MDPNLRNALEFVRNLERLDPSSRHELRRFAGRELIACPQAWQLFYQVLPHTVPSWREPMYFSVATVFGLAPNRGPQNLGASLGLAARSASVGSAERYLNFLLYSDLVGLAHWLPPTIRYLGSAGIGVHWFRLVCDLQCWGSDTKRVQRGWARAFLHPRKG